MTPIAPDEEDEEDDAPDEPLELDELVIAPELEDEPGVGVESSEHAIPRTSADIEHTTESGASVFMAAHPSQDAAKHKGLHSRACSPSTLRMRACRRASLHMSRRRRSNRLVW